ncbi:carbohydrate ABC transporter permease [Conexibacter stalactiti]|uniref:Carbohydrate ABC transporter permease n=1 Tax=Conexibacter stalactiti TaxID=1940611 RepID=A0ABU4HQ12_9ACTN|nr:carbohydrate ABC transporter permease [Conexibacter stalactiti]MDW5595413.1 carbohydrate ABC transporter permease [Conexibacter stalactiti]MEC5036055.1 carbohydrate ABC transporter permease [Conexibacter stalactiti]
MTALLATRARRGGVYVALTIAAAVFVFPLVWMLMSSLKPADEIITAPFAFDPGAITFDNFRTAFDEVPLVDGFRTTAIVLLIRGGLTMLFCPLAGFAFAKLDFRGRNVLFGFILLTLMLPTLVLIVPLLLEMSELGWVNSYQALILPGAIDAFAIFWMRQTISAIPDELLDAGRIDGCNPFQLFSRIVLPVIKPALAALAVLTFLNIYNDFVWPVVAVGGGDKQTLQVVLSALATQVNASQLGTNYWGQLVATSTLATLPVLLLFVVLQRQFMQGLLAGSVKG